MILKSFLQLSLLLVTVAVDQGNVHGDGEEVVRPVQVTDAVLRGELLKLGNGLVARVCGVARSEPEYRERPNP